MSLAKIKTRAQLQVICRQLKHTGKRLVTTNGSFDLLHVGHIRMLEQARQYGDILIVGLNSDRSIKSYKGPQRPIIPQEQRAELLAALACVDYVSVFDEPVPMPFLQAVVPDVHVNHASYGQQCIEAPTLRELGSRLVLIDNLAPISTTQIINKIISLARSEQHAGN